MCAITLKSKVTKIKYMIINRKNISECDLFELKVNSDVIEPIKSIKHLGIIIDNKLKFDEQISYSL